jgi:hypothetical protein
LHNIIMEYRSTKNWPIRKLVKFSLITIVLVLLLLEVVFRVLFAINYKGYHTSVHVQGNTLQMSDSALVFRNRPFYVDYYKRFQFNEEGLKSRAGQFSMPDKTPNDFWVFLFGGSAMEGTGSNKDGEWLDITGVMDHTYEETIAACLERYLQQRIPGKKVKVFNAANSGFAISQSMTQYLRLAGKYQMDWVVSMDAENEPPSLQPGETTHGRIKDRWEQSPLFDFPLNVIIPVTSHSALANKLKQAVFHSRLSGRLEKNIKNDFPARRNWLNKPSPLRFAQKDAAITNALNSFYAGLTAFDSLLTARHQRHLLYIQPHLAFRNQMLMSPTEKALFNYYTATYNDSVNNTFKRNVFNGFNKEYFVSGDVRSLAGLHDWKEEVFVDYCHFTKQANELIAKLIAEDILKQ